MFNSIIQNANLRVTGNRIHQTDRNKLRVQLINVLKEHLQAQNIEVGLVKEGIAVSTFNEEIGEVNFIIDIKMKDLNFDFEDEKALFEFDMSQKQPK
jgi:hypothetical protein